MINNNTLLWVAGLFAEFYVLAIFGLETALVLGGIAGATAIYFLPTIIASARKKRNALPDSS